MLRDQGGKNMVPSESDCQKSSLFLNQFALRLNGAPAAFKVHYWGGKAAHPGNTDHAHNFFEICYVANGEGNYLNDGVRYSLRKGTIYAAKPGSSHRIDSLSDMLLLFVAFDLIKEESEPVWIENYEQLMEQPHLFVPGADDTAVAYLWKSLILQSSNPNTAHPELITRMAHALLCSTLLFFKEYSGQVAAVKTAETGGKSLTLATAEQYVQNRLSQKLTVKEVARSLHVSERQLSRLLSEELGQTFPAWVRTERTRSAVYLLAYTDKSIQEIAAETGFDTVHYFTRVFDQTLQITPGKFRKEMKRKNPSDPSFVHRYLDLLVRRHRK